MNIQKIFEMQLRDPPDVHEIVKLNSIDLSDEIVRKHRTFACCGDAGNQIQELPDEGTPAHGGCRHVIGVAQRIEMSASLLR